MIRLIMNGIGMYEFLLFHTLCVFQKGTNVFFFFFCDWISTGITSLSFKRLWDRSST